MLIGALAETSQSQLEKQMARQSICASMISLQNEVESKQVEQLHGGRIKALNNKEHLSRQTFHSFESVAPWWSFKKLRSLGDLCGAQF